MISIWTISAILLSGCYRHEIVITDTKDKPIKDVIAYQSNRIMIPYHKSLLKTIFYKSDTSGKITLEDRLDLIIGKKGYYPAYIYSNYLDKITNIKLVEITNKKKAIWINRDFEYSIPRVHYLENYIQIELFLKWRKYLEYQKKLNKNGYYLSPQYYQTKAGSKLTHEPDGRLVR